MDLEDRFMKFVEKTESCWIWKGCKDVRGYGRISIHNKPWLAHRVSYILYKDFPEMELLHSCDNPSCVNPEHLSQDTHQKNMRDAQDRGRMKQPCLRGSKHSQSKLTETDVVEIRRLCTEGKSANFIGKKFGIGRNNVYAIRDKKTWIHV